MRRLIRIFLVPAVFAVGIIGSLYSSGGRGDIAKELELAMLNDLDAALTTLKTCDTVYTRIGEDSSMIVTCRDTVAVADRALWPQCMDWGPADTNIWVGTYWDVGDDDFRRWYALDTATSTLVDSFGTPIDPDTGWGTWTVQAHGPNPRINDSLKVVMGDTLAAPRGAAWTVTGDTMYTADFDGNVIKRWTGGAGSWAFDDTVETGPSPHCVLVDPENKLWISYYGYTDTLFNVEGLDDTVKTCRISIYNADGTPASFSPIMWTTLGVGGDTTALDGSRGMSLDHNGNILDSDIYGLFRFNHQTGAVMNHVKPSLGVGLTDAAVTSEGFIFLAGVVPGGTPIAIYSPNFTFYGNAYAATSVISRSLVVSADGKDLYHGQIYGGVNGVLHYYSADGVDGTFELVDTLGSIFHYEEKVTKDTTVILPAGIDPYDGVPQEYALSQNYPNPFNPETWISYQLPKTEPVTLSIYNILGQKVRTLVNDVRVAGEHSLIWDGTDDSGMRLPSGIYIYRLETNTITLSKKMVMMK